MILAPLPNVAEWAHSQVGSALSATGTSAELVGIAALNAHGVVYEGMRLFGDGATLAGLILGATAAFVVDRRFDRAAMYALIGAVLALTAHDLAECRRSPRLVAWRKG